MHEVKILSDGVEFVAMYETVDDTLRVRLPDGSTRETELRGLKAEQAALTHLRAYVQSKVRRL